MKAEVKIRLVSKRKHKRKYAKDLPCEIERKKKYSYWGREKETGGKRIDNQGLKTG